MIKSLRFLLPLAALFPAVSHATDVDIDSNWYVRLDGQYYRVGAGTFAVGGQQIALGVLPTSLNNCRRNSGAGQVMSTASLTFGGGSGLVYLKQGQGEFAIVFDHGAAVLDLASATADIVCDGAQLPPGTPDTVFESSFEDQA